MSVAAIPRAFDRLQYRRAVYHLAMIALLPVISITDWIGVSFNRVLAIVSRIEFSQRFFFFFFLNTQLKHLSLSLSLSETFRMFSSRRPMIKSKRTAHGSLIPRNVSSSEKSSERAGSDSRVFGHVFSEERSTRLDTNRIESSRR